MKKASLLLTALFLVGFLSISFVQGQSCDTLRNYKLTDPINASTIVGGGLFLGHASVKAGTDTYKVHAWAEPYNLAESKELRALNIAAWRVGKTSGTGFVTFNVYEDNAGVPGNVLRSQKVNFTDLTAASWNTVKFTNPIALNGDFHVGYELDYTMPIDSFALYGTQPSDIDYTMYFIKGTGALNETWQEAGLTFESTKSAFAVELLFSDGIDPKANYTVSAVKICQSDEFKVDASASTGTIDTYNWILKEPGLPNFYVDFYGNKIDVVSPTTSNPSIQNLFLMVSGACVNSVKGYIVDVMPDVKATVTVTDDNCGNGGSISISATGGVSPYSYSIDGGGTTETAGTFANLSGDNYDVVVKSSLAGCNIYEEQVEIISTTPEELSVDEDKNICVGDEVIITASGNGNIEWFEGITSVGTGKTITVSPTDSTVYDVILTDANNCKDEQQVKVNVSPNKDPGFSFPTNTICLGGINEVPTVITNGGIFTVDVTGLVFVDSSTGEINMTETVAGTYKITYTISGLCGGSDAQTLTITQNPDATFTYAKTIYCQDEGTTSPVFVDDASAGVFSSTSGLVIKPETGNIDLSSSAPGYYVITNSIAASGACSATSKTFNINVSVNPTVSAGVDIKVCKGIEIFLKAASSGGVITWDNGVVDGVPFTPNSSGTYTVTVDNNGCIATDEVIVTVNPLPEVDAGTDKEVCINHLSFPLTGTPSGGTFSGIGVTANKFAPGTAGIGKHTTTYKYKDANGCENSATLVIDVDGCVGLDNNELSNVTVSPNPASDYIEVHVSDNNKINNVQLMSLEGKVVPANYFKLDSQTTQIDISSVANGTYFIQISSANGLLVKKVIVQ